MLPTNPLSASIDFALTVLKLGSDITTVTLNGLLKLPLPAKSKDKIEDVLGGLNKAEHIENEITDKAS